jgi:pyruvate/2-oxoglutarate dehydrogenase complex dihydrolipoamide acyltransferase (E2) component
MSEVVMPRLSDSMEEGTILTWLKQVGDEIAVGDELVEIETDKANMAYESDTAGTLQEILAQEGETLPIGSPIARIGEGSNGDRASDEGQAARPAGPVDAGDPPPPARQEGVPPTTPPTADAPPPDDPPPAEEEEAEAAPPVGGDDAGPSPVGEGDVSETGPAGQPDLSLEEIQRVWPTVLHKLHESAPALAGALEGARPVTFEEGLLEVGFPPDMTFLKRNADSPEKRDTVAAAFAAVTGVGLRPTYVLLDGEAPPDTPAPGSEEIDEEGLLEHLKSEFDAEEVS